MVEAVRYFCSVRLDGVRRVVLWESGNDGTDQVVVDESGMLCEFPSEALARRAPLPPGRVLSPEPVTHYDFDAVQEWCHSDSTTLECATLLNAWNLLGDLPQPGTLFAWADGRAKKIYDKLFFGCNFPSITPEGARSTPSLSAAELAALKRVLLLGLAEFRARLHWSPLRAASASRR